MGIFDKRVAFKPFEYPDVVEYKDAINHSYWLVSEWNFIADVHDFKNLNEIEKNAIKNALLAISQIEVSVKAFWTKLGDRFPKPEITQVGVTFGECFVDKTEILTPNGWVDLSLVKVGDDVLQYNSNNTFNITKVLHKFDKEYSGEVFRFSKKTTESIVTPNHRIVYYDINDKFSEIAASKINCKNSNNKIPESGKLIGGKEISLSFMDKLRIAIQADGNKKYYNSKDTKNPRKENGLGSEYEIRIKKERKIKRLDEILENIDSIVFTKKQLPSRPDMYIYTIRIDDKFDYKEFDWVNLYDKTSNWCLEFIEELAEWNGYKTKGKKDCKIKFGNTNKKVADVAQFVGVAAGYRTNLITSIDKRCETYKPMYIVSFTENRLRVTIPPLKKESINYDGMVRCITVESGNIISRYNNKTFISGNSEVRHSDAYSHLLEILDLNDDFAMLLQNPIIQGRVDYLTKYLKGASDNCHDTETELLTKRGWLKYYEITDEDEAATKNPKNNKFEWQKINKIFVNEDYSGSMITLSGDHNLNVKVTPNHRMYVSRFKYKRDNENKLQKIGLTEPGFVDAENLKTQSIIYFSCDEKNNKPIEKLEIQGVQHNRLYSQETSHPQNKTILMDDFLPFLGWWISEGWTYSKGNPYQIGINQKTNSIFECNHIQKSINLMKKYDFNIQENHNKNGITSWNINNKSLWNWLRENCGTNSYTKKLPLFVNDLSSRQQSVLLESLILGDGHLRTSGSMVYFTISKELADQVQSLAIQCGYISHIGKIKTNGVIPVIIKKSSKNFKVNKKHISKEKYSGVVWCVGVNNELIFTRRNGKTILSGNSNESYTLTLTLFSIFIEYVSLFSQFLVIKSFNKYKNILKDVDNVIQATQKEEFIHGMFGISLIKHIQKEYPEWFNDDFYEKLYRACKKAFDAEVKIIDWMFEKGELPFMPKDLVVEFIKNRFNESLVLIGGKGVFDIDRNKIEKLKWFDDEIYSDVSTDFFHKKPVTYNKFSKPITSNDLF